MASSDGSAGARGLPRYVRALIVGVTCIVYGALFLWALSVNQPAMAALAVVPIGLVAWWSGWRFGLLVAVALIIFQASAATVAGTTPAVVLRVYVASPGALALLLVGGAVGVGAQWHQAAVAARDRAERYFALAENPMVLVDRVGSICRVNAAAAALVGDTEENLVGRGWLQAFLASDHVAEAHRRMVGWLRSGLQPETVEAPLQSGETAAPIFAWQASILPEKPAPTLLLVGVDVTAQRRASAAHLASARRSEVLARIGAAALAATDVAAFARALVNATGEVMPVDGVVALGPEANQRAFRVFAARVDGRPLPADDTANCVLEPQWSALFSATGTLTGEALASSPLLKALPFVRDARATWVRAAPAGPAHAPLGLLVVFGRGNKALADEDEHVLLQLANKLALVTQAVERAASVRQQERQLREMFENSPIGLYRTTPEGRILMVNRALLSLLGYASMNELRELTVERAGISPDDRARFKLAVETGGIVRAMESKWTRKDGSLVHVRETARAVRDAQGDVLCYEGAVEDVTEARHAERAWREQVEMNAALVRAQAEMGIGILLMENGRPAFINRALCDILGRSREEIMQMSDLTTMVGDEEERQTILDQAAADNANGIPTRHYMTRARRPDGHVVDVELSVVVSNSHESRRSVVIARDVTERHRAEEALRESQARFQQMAANVDAVLWVLDPRAPRSLYVSPAFERIWGQPLPEGEGLVKVWLDSVHPDDREMLPARRARAEPTSATYRIVRSDGGIRWISDRSFPVRGADGELEGVVGIASDVTNAKEAEERYREASAYARSVVDSSLDGIAALDADGQILDANVALGVLSGEPPGRLIGRRFAELFSDPARVLDAQARAIVASEARDLLVDLPSASGDVANVLVDATAVRDARGALKFVLASVRDVTERMRLERDALQQREMINRTERLSALGTLVAGVAHEINNPLTYIQGNIELALLDLDEAREALERVRVGDGPDLAHTRRALESALGGTERISQITKALKAVARQKQPATEIERVDLVSVLRNVEALTRIGAAEGVSLSFDAPAGSVWVMGNASELHQVLLNLLSNAIDALRGKKDGHVRVALEQREGFAEISVSDDGPGIAPEVMSQLFTPFFTTKPHGTGLGLAIAHRIVVEHGGDIRVESHPNMGATFHVLLPLASAAPSPAGMVLAPDGHPAK